MTIRNYISLVDQTTPVFRAITRAMNTTLNVMQRVNQQSGGTSTAMGRAFRTAQHDIQRANNEIIRMQNNLRRASSGMNDVAGAAGGVSRAFASMNSGGFNLVNFTAALYLINKIKDSIKEMMESADDARATTARLGLFNTSKYTNDQLYSAVYGTALETRSGLRETGDLATRILVSGAMQGEGAAIGAIKAAGIINKALVAGGGTAEENSRAILQLSQALASGNLQGDELRSIREQTPYLAKVLAEGLGKVDPKFANVTLGQLKQLGAEGELTTERIIKAFQAMEPEITAAFKSMPKTFGQALTQISNVWKYFLYLLSLSDGPLAKVNERIWQFADYLASADGQRMLEGLADAISIVVDAVLWLIDLAVSGFEWLQQNADVATAAFITLGVAAAAAAVYAAVAWIAAAWPVLLVVAAIGALIYALLQAGITAEQIVGSILGGIGFLINVIYDAAILIIVIGYWIVSIIWDAVVVLVTGLILLLQGIVQAVLIVVASVINLFTGMWVALQSIGDAIYAIFAGAVSGIYSAFAWLSIGILEIIQGIASAIDAVFGSNLADSVQSLQNNLKTASNGLYNYLNPEGSWNKITERFKNTEYIDPWDPESEWNITDRMDNVIKIAEGLMLDPTLLDEWGFGSLIDPMEGWDAGYKMGSDLVKELEKYDFDMGLDKLSEMQDVLDNWDPNSVTMNGGYLDEIKGDVDLSDEDIKLLRDIAARDFLLNLQTITPTVNAKFGDVRETADVNEIMDILEQMVVEAAATSLS